MLLRISPLEKTPWFYIVSIVGIYLFIYLHFMYLYYSCYHLPRRMGLLWSGALSEDSIKQSNFTRLPVRISAPQPICRNL